MLASNPFDQIANTILDPQNKELKLVRKFDETLKVIMVSYIPETLGEHRIHITYENNPIEGSPFLVNVLQQKHTSIQIASLFKQVTPEGIFD